MLSIMPVCLLFSYFLGPFHTVPSIPSFQFPRPTSSLSPSQSPMHWGINVLPDQSPRQFPLPIKLGVPLPFSPPAVRAPPILFSGSNGRIRSARAVWESERRSGTAREAGERRAASGADMRHRSMGVPASRRRGQPPRPRLTRLGALATQPAAKGLRAALGWRPAPNPA
ncbi:hypothetical protein GUJ93_ZPchr0013g35935 [Zizania palustris]|uniref:Uncharacterized protein n=1 Tax=Zizania palustris TaxID=103762 RepID=A0A8J5WVV3_ZIZPA|nr:hypothetical protein GUJ93_ZPchr0013g35935 [Zizania palustris]